MSGEPRLLALFPLNVVLFPGMTLPLHIFEERYKAMIADCLDDDREFGIVWMSDDGLRPIGCACEVTEVLERMDDGRMNILVEGGDVFRLLRRIDELPYPAGDVELLDEEKEAGEDHSGDARSRYADLVEEVTDSRPGERELEQLDSYRMAASLDFALEAKQGLLELRSEPARRGRLTELFAQALDRLRRAEQTAELARTNGHARRRP